MKIPQTIDDLLDMAYDNDNLVYPIYRSPDMNFSVHCLATGNILTLFYFNYYRIFVKLKFNSSFWSEK